jgi:hypothetical protein
MTSRRGTLVEDGAREQLQVHGYLVRIVPSGFNKRYPPAHLIASREPDETRYIKIIKISHRSPCIDTIQSVCRKDLVRFRKHLSRHSHETGLHCEIWIYSLCYGFRCFEILTDSVREIPKLSLTSPSTPPTGGTA